MFDYRLAKETDDYFNIMKFSFSLKKNLWDVFKDRSAKFFNDPNRELYGAYFNDEMIAEYLLISFDMKLRDSVIPVGGISNVCTSPLYRERGAIKFLLENSLITMKNKNQPVSLLYPFDVEFYRKYGWEVFDSLLRLKLSPGSIRKIADNEKIQIVSVDEADEQIRNFYNSYAKDHYSMILKDNCIWNEESKFWTGEDIAKKYVKFYSDNELKGILRYVFVSDKNSGSALYITFFITENDEIEKSMWNFLRKLSLQIKDFNMFLPLDYVVWPYIFGNPIEMKIEQRSMIRIVDMMGLNGLKVNHDNISLNIKVDDPQAEWNTGIFNISIKENILKISRTDTSDLECNINTLSAIIGGRTDFKEMIKAGRVKIIGNYNGQDISKSLPFVLQGF